MNKLSIVVCVAISLDKIYLKILKAIYVKGHGRVSITPMQIVNEENISDERLGDILLILQKKGCVINTLKETFIPGKTLENRIITVEITPEGKELLRNSNCIISS